MRGRSYPIFVVHYFFSVILAIVIYMFGFQTVYAQISGFGEQHLLGKNAVSNPTKTLTADVNGDSLIDLIVLSEGRLGWYQNNGDGTFGSRHFIADDTTYLRRADAVDGDFDGDGNPDIVAVSQNYNDPSIIIYRNDGGGSFTSETIPTSLQGSSRLLATGDLNGDHLLDIILVLGFTDHGQSVYWLKNQGNGHFDSPILLLTDNDTGLSGRPIVTDFDDDGDLDLIVNDVQEFLLLKNNGNGQFTSPITLGNTGKQESFYARWPKNSLAISDLNNDGFKDFVATKVFEDDNYNIVSTVLWMKNQSNMNVGTPSPLSDTLIVRKQNDPYNLFYHEIQFSSVTTADINKDGMTDVIVAANGSDFISWYENNGNGSSWTQHMIDTADGGPIQLTLADIDNDGYPDVIATLSGYDQIAYYLNNGDGTFSKKNIADQASNSNVSIVVAADMDGDGDNDVVTGIHGHDIIWYKNDGSGNFQGPISICTTEEPFTSLKIADLNGDHNPDILFYGARNLAYGKNSVGATGALGWVKNWGNGTFDSPWIINKSYPDYDVQVADINRDGNVDILALQQNSIVWFIGTSYGNWYNTATVVVNPDITTNPVLLQDLDADGHPDLAYFTNFLDSNTVPPKKVQQVHIMKNNGLGGLAERNNFLTDFLYWAKIEAIDIDKDSLPDIIMSPSTFNRSIAPIYEYRNKGGLSFEAVGQIGPPDYYLDIASADLNHDGYPDLVTSYGWAENNDTNEPIGHGISWYQNLGNGTFDIKRVITNQVNRPFAVYASDLDGDGLPDVLSASANDDKLAWYKNQTGGITNHMVPDPPQQLGAQGLPDRIKLEWTNDTGYGIRLFKIFRSTSPIDSSAAWIDQHTQLDSVDASQTTYMDSTCTSNTIYYYRVVAISNANVESAFSNQVQTALGTSVNDTKSTLPKKFALHQNYPNPFNPTTTIAYDLPKPEHVTLRVYNVLGRLVYSLVDRKQAAGRYTVQFNASSLASGLYFYRIHAGSFVVTKKLMLIK